jgi:predicted nuclease of predicted toxin-antitoxin system
LRDGIATAVGAAPWSESENADPFVVEDGLEQLRDRGYRLIVMLDELEAIGRRLSEFQDWGEDWRSKASAGLFSLVIATKRPLGEVYGSLGLTSPFDNIFSKTMLGSLASADWRQLVKDGLPGIDRAELDWIDRLAGGWALYVQMAAAMVWQFGGLAEAEREFRFQADDRFRELWKDLGAEQSVLRTLVQTGRPIDPTKGLGDRLCRYGVVRSDGQLFSEAFGDWIRESGGAVWWRGDAVIFEAIWHGEVTGFDGADYADSGAMWGASLYSGDADSGMWCVGDVGGECECSGDFGGFPGFGDGGYSGLFDFCGAPDWVSAIDGMKIWVDAQLPPRLAEWLAATFPVEACSLRDLGLRDAKDVEIFEAARREGEGLVIMTKDSDFVDLVCRLGVPPQILWLTCGNVTNRNLQQLLNATFLDALAELGQGERVVEIGSWVSHRTMSTTSSPIALGIWGRFGMIYPVGRNDNGMARAGN